MNEEYNCEFCDKQMTEEEHDFCDICGDCREENDEETEDDIVLLVSRVTKHKKYPFQEGDDYWTLKENIFIWSCWDDVSKEFHDENPGTEYYTDDEVLDIAKANGIKVL